MEKVKSLLCIYHSVDLDGWMSAAIVKKWAEENDCNATFLGWNYGQPVPDTIGYDILVLCDVSFPAYDMLALQKRYYVAGGASGFIWCDHHISAINAVKEIFEANAYPSYPEGLRSTAFAACELTWQHFFPELIMPEIVRMLGRYDCFGHKGTKEEYNVLAFQYGARARLTNYEQCYIALVDHPEMWANDLLSDGRVIYEFLKTEAIQAWNNAYGVIMLTQEQGWVNIACINKERFNPVNFGIDYHGQGYDVVACFWYQDRKWRFSLYNDNGKIDCSVIAKCFGGGGHKGAAGFVSDDIKPWENKN